VAAPTGLTVTLAVTNHGSKAGATTCRLFDPDASGIGPESEYATSPRIDPGQTTTFSTVVTSLGTEVRPVGVSCSGT
jgi:hypothetical protein